MRAQARILRVAVAASAAAALAAAAGHDGLWLCVPLALFVATTEPGTGAGLLAGAAVLLAGTLAGGTAPAAIAGSASALLVLVVQRARLERERDAMRHFALRDPLTGLANRRALDDRLRHEVARHLRQRERFALLALDLDGFKRINDRFGHETGDELLREVADALRAAVRGQDTVARLGGDEFCVVAPQTDEDGAAYLAERVVAALDGVAAGISGFGASVGSAVFPDDGHDPAALLAAADAEALDVKRRRRAARTRRAA